MDSIAEKVVLITGQAEGIIGLSVVKTFLVSGVKGVAMVHINEEVRIQQVTSSSDK